MVLLDSNGQYHVDHIHSEPNQFIVGFRTNKRLHLNHLVDRVFLYLHTSLAIFLKHQ